MSEAEGGGAPLSMCDWRDLTSTLVSSCLIYFMTQHISRTTDTTLIPRHTKNTCHDGTRSSRTQKLPTNTPTQSQSEPIEIQSDATRCSQLSALPWPQLQIAQTANNDSSAFHTEKLCHLSTGEPRSELSSHLRRRCRRMRNAGWENQ